MFNLIRDEAGKLSSTRLINLVTLALFVFLSVCDAVMEVQLSSQIYNIIQTILAVGIAGQSVRVTASHLSHTVSADSPE